MGGYHKVVIDTEQPGTKWTLSARLMTTDLPGVPGTLAGFKFIAIARSDYQGFVSHKDLALDQVRNHNKIKEFTSLASGKILIVDGGGDFNNTGSSDRDGIVMTHSDGYFPVHVHRDSKGKIDLIMVQCMPDPEDSLNSRRKLWEGILDDAEERFHGGDTQWAKFCSCPHSQDYVRRMEMKFSPS